MKKSKNSEDSNARAGSSQQRDARRRKSSDDDDSKALSRTKSVFQRPRAQDPKPATRTTSHIQSHEYKSRKADDFMPSLPIPGVKYPPPQSGDRKDASPGPTRRRSSSAEPRQSSQKAKYPSRRQTITNPNIPRATEANTDNLRAITFGPTDTNHSKIKTNITVFTTPVPKELPKSKDPPSPGKPIVSEIAKPKGADMKGNGEPQGIDMSPTNKGDQQGKSPQTGTTPATGPTKQSEMGDATSEKTQSKKFMDPQQSDTHKVPNRPESPPTMVLMAPKNQTPQTVRKVPGGRVIIENSPRKVATQQVGPAKAVDKYEPVETNKDDLNIQFKITNEKPVEVLHPPPTTPPAHTSDPPPTTLPTQPPDPSPMTPPSQPPSPKPMQKVQKLPGGRVIIENTPRQKTTQQVGPAKAVDTYKPADTNKDDIKIQFKIEKPNPVDLKGPPPSTPPVQPPQSPSTRPPAQPPQSPSTAPPTKPPPAKVSQTVRRLPGGRVIIENSPRQKPTEQVGPAMAVDKYEPADTNEGDVKIQFKVAKPKPVEETRPPSPTPPSQTEPPPPQKVQTQPGGRVIIKGTPPQVPVSEQIAPDVIMDTYAPADTNKDGIKIQLKVAKQKPVEVIPPPPPTLPPRPPKPPSQPVPPKPPSQPPPIPKPPSQPPPAPKPPPPAPKPQQPPPIVKISPPTTPKPIPKPSSELKSFQDDEKERSRSNALLEYLNTMSKLTAQELERDEIPSPEFADDNIDVVQLLKKFNIPDQQRALDSLLDTDSVHYDFGGLMRQYYSYVLRSYCPINMQDRYRGVSHPASCFTSVDLSRIGTREEEMEKLTRAKLRKLDEKREQLRTVAVDEDHFNYLKNLANDQTTLLPLTVVHMLNEQMAPILEDVFRFYGKNLGTEHKSTKEAGFHYMKIRKRCEMYTHICGSSTINEDLASYYK